MDKKERIKNLKDKLRNWGSGNALVRNKRDEYENICSLYKSGQRDGLVSEECLFGYKSLAEQVFRDVCDHMNEKARIDEALEKLDSLEKKVITVRYAKRIGWDMVPAYLPCAVSPRQCYRIHKAALEKLLELLDE